MSGRWAKALLKAPVLLYRYLLSPVLPPRCRYLPTCSEYAIEAIETHGPARGAYLAAHRLCRCHPWGGSGLDPVPPVSGDRQAAAGSQQGTT